MFKSTTVAGIVLATAFTVSSASAHDVYGHGHHTNTVTTPSYTNTYTAPTINLGPIEQVQPNSTVQYVQPATTTTYTAPSYTTPSYVAPQTYTYTAPSYGSTTTVPAATYGTSYTTPINTVPTYTAPAYVAPLFDATQRVQARMDRLRTRIFRAANRGDLRRGERSKLRRKMRNIRHMIDAYKADDGVIDRQEFAKVNERMSRQSKRIRRLANNDRVVGQFVSPFGQQPRF